jgi:hypothetical protein
MDKLSEKVTEQDSRHAVFPVSLYEHLRDEGSQLRWVDVIAAIADRPELCYEVATNPRTPLFILRVLAGCPRSGNDVYRMLASEAAREMVDARVREMVGAPPFPDPNRAYRRE